jgi:hypothetical protein
VISALAASGALAVAVKITESYPALQAQVKADQVRDAVFNKKAHTVHIVLKSLTRENVLYPSHQYLALTAQLKAQGAKILLTHAKVKKKSTHHKLRYIAGGIVVVAVIGIAGLLYVRRRRYMAEGGGPGVGAGTPPPAGDESA